MRINSVGAVVAPLLLTATAAGLWFWVSAPDGTETSEVTVVDAVPASIRDTRVAASSQPPSTPARPVAGSSYVTSRELLAELGLPATAVVRSTIDYDRANGVTCGELSLSSSDATTRRFVYIAAAKTGFLDDGGKLFKQVNEASCVRRD